MLVLTMIACEPEQSVVTTSVDTSTTPVIETDTGTPPVDTGTTEPVELTTDCLLVGEWDLQIRGWIDRGWTANCRQTNIGCSCDVQTDIPGTVEVTDIAVGLDDWTGSALYTGLFTRQPQPLLFRPVEGGWDVDGQFTAIGSVWSLRQR